MLNISDSDLLHNKKDLNLQTRSVRIYKNIQIRLSHPLASNTVSAY